jgi:uncharacterized membrane protein
MRALTLNRRLWFYRILSLIVTAILAHLLAVWAVPRIAMYVVMYGPAAREMNMLNQAAFPPQVTDSSRNVVMPSPDMLYSVCVFDVSNGPVRVTGHPKLQSYWSIALYGANSDNFFSINDRNSNDQPVDLWLVSEGGNGQGPVPPPTSTVVVAPTTQGLLLMRVLTGDYEAEKAVVEAARRSLNCSRA